MAQMATHYGMYIEMSMAKKSEKDKCSTFLYVIGQKGCDMYNAMNLDDIQCDKIDVLFTKFKEYCKPKQNVRCNCRKISIQHPSARQLRTNRLICHWFTIYYKNCSFRNLEDELIRDTIVFGVNSDDAK